MATPTPRFRRLSNDPAKTILALEWREELGDRLELRDALGELLSQEPRKLELIGATMRGVGLDRLPLVLASGIDVQPADAVVYVDELDKALEYGGEEKLILILDPNNLASTWEEVDASLDPKRLSDLRSRYQTELRSEDGRTVWFSRLPRSDRRVSSDYEVAYARWIPGDPQEALLGLLLVGPDLDRLVAAWDRALGADTVSAARWA